MVLNTKIFRASFYGNLSRNKKVTGFDSKLAFLRKFLY